MATQYAGLPDFFSPTQWETFYALASTIIPPLTAEEQEQLIAEAGPGKDLEAVREYARVGATVDNLSFRKHAEEVLGSLVLPKARKDLGLVLNLLSSGAFCRVFTFSAAFSSLPHKDREALLALWLGQTPGMVAFPPLRIFAKSVVSLVRSLYLRGAAENPETGLIKALGVVPPVKVESGNWYDFKFLECKDGNVFETDIVIVGSGPAGGIVAEKLAKEGWKVMVVEKGEWFSPAQLPMPDNKFGSMFENKMILSTDDGLMTVLAGSGLGGGGTINWSACLQPQAKVRADWVKHSGLDFFNSADFQDCLDTISERIGVAPVKRHNHRNQVLLNGAKRLGYTVIEVPQNTGGEEHWDGYCGAGCGDGIEGKGCKTGPTRSTLPVAADNGAQFIKNFNATKVTFNGKTATGVEGKWTSGTGHVSKVSIKARRVIVSAGALQTPLLLQRSGLMNAHIGKNLRLHPTAVVTAIFPVKTNPLEGGILTTAVTEFEDLDGDFHGVKLETAWMSPTLTCAATPWKPDGVGHRKDIIKYDQTGLFISLCRDSSSGRVYPDRETGNLKIDYTVPLLDKKHILIGYIALCKMAYTQGCIEFRSPLTGIKAWVRPASELGKVDPHASPSLKEYLSQLEKLLTAKDIPFAALGTAHQMGTARMGKDPKLGAVDVNGRVWGKRGLYVADASLLPSACGVNPQISTMALAEWVGRKVAEDLRTGKDVAEAKL